MFLEISQNSQENTCARVSFLIKLQGLSPATLLKKRLWHRCFPVNFVKFLRTPLLQNTSGRLLLLSKQLQQNQPQFMSHIYLIINSLILYELVFTNLFYYNKQRSSSIQAVNAPREGSPIGLKYYLLPYSVRQYCSRHIYGGELDSPTIHSPFYFIQSTKYFIINPAGIYLLKVNNRNTRTRCEICSKLTIKTPERRLASFWCLYC